MFFAAAIFILNLISIRGNDCTPCVISPVAARKLPETLIYHVVEVRIWMYVERNLCGGKDRAHGGTVHPSKKNGRLNYRSRETHTIWHLTTLQLWLRPRQCHSSYKCPFVILTVVVRLTEPYLSLGLEPTLLQET
jgi:hypothetical protein